MRPTGCLRDSACRLRRDGGMVGWGWCSQVCASSELQFDGLREGGGTREAGSTVAESLLALYQVGTHQIRRRRRTARSSTSQGSAEPLCARSKGANREVSEYWGKSWYLRANKEQRTSKIRGAFSGMHRTLDGWILARAPASPGQGLQHHGPWCFNFPYFCTMAKTYWSVICPLCCWERWPWVGDNSSSRSRLLSIWSKEVRRFDEPFWQWSVPLLVVPHNLSRFGSLLVWVAGCHHDATRWPSYLFVTTSGIGIW